MAPMSQTQTTRLRESHTPVRQGVTVIDAQYEVVGKPSVWRRAITVLAAVFWAAAIGFAVPQIWNFATQIGAFFAQS